MKSLKRSAVIFTISIVGLLTIRAAEKRDVAFSGEHYSLESLAWQSIPLTDELLVSNHVPQDPRRLSMMRKCIFPEVSGCTRIEQTHSNR